MKNAGLVMLLGMALLAAGCDGGGGGGGGGDDDPKPVNMRWWFVDGCNDGVGPNVELYQIADGGVDGYWGPWWIQFYNTPLYADIKCYKGDKICFGAWDSSGNQWGCGQNCVFACPDCCELCGPRETANKVLTCSAP